MTVIRTTAREKAKQIIELLENEQPDYNYLREIFRHIRKGMGVKVENWVAKKIPYVPTEEELAKYYKEVWQSKNIKDVMIVKTLLYTGIKSSELTKIKLSDVDLDKCQIKIDGEKEGKSRIVPFPNSFMELFAV